MMVMDVPCAVSSHITYSKDLAIAISILVDFELFYRLMPGHLLFSSISFYLFIYLKYVLKVLLVPLFIAFSDFVHTIYKIKIFKLLIITNYKLYKNITN